MIEHLPKSHSSSKPEFPKLSDLKILLVEDDRFFQKLILLTLRQMGYSADLVDNGRVALEALRHQTYNLILMDLQMPELDGISTTLQIRQMTSSNSNPWIVALTANKIVGGQEACRIAGMNDYLTKPLQPDEFAQALSRYRLG